MTVEIVGEQLRLRILSPRLCVPDSFRIQDVGRSGRLQRVACISRRSRRFMTQSWRLNLSDYSSPEDAAAELSSIKGISRSQKSRASGLIRAWFSRR